VPVDVDCVAKYWTGLVVEPPAFEEVTLKTYILPERRLFRIIE
jgi:hypothetical protein